MIYNNKLILLLLEQLSQEKSIRIITQGKSMLPLINDGEYVYIKKSTKYYINDIIAYYIINNGKFEIIVHRIIFLREKYVLTRGDNNNYIDPYKVYIENILGKIIIQE